MLISSSITLTNIKDGADGKNGIDGQHGKDGKNGISVLSITIQYGKSNSETLAPSSWNEVRPPRNTGEVLWARELIKYSNSTTKTTTPRPLTGDKGEKGDTGEEGEGAVGLGYKLNATSLTASNNGEIFFFGYTYGLASNIDGWIRYQDKKYKVLKGYINPGNIYKLFPYKGYLAANISAASKVVSIRFDGESKSFVFVDAGYSGAVDINNWVAIGEFGMLGSEMCDFATLYSEGRSLKPLKNGELSVPAGLELYWNSTTLTVSSVNKTGYLKYKEDYVYLPPTSKTFTKAGEGYIIADLESKKIYFTSLRLENITLDGNNIYSIVFKDFETSTRITSRHENLNSAQFIKLGEFKTASNGSVVSASIDEKIPLDSFLQKSFMKIFNQSDGGIDDFENWLSAMDLTNFYKSLVVSNLFVNELLANTGTFLKELKITNSNILGDINSKVDAPALFDSGLSLKPYGSIEANWGGLDPITGYPKKGWKITGDGRSFFVGSTIIDANVQGLEAETISHPALTTIKEISGEGINLSIAKNEWHSTNSLNGYNPPSLPPDTFYNITYENKSYDCLFRLYKSQSYLLNDTNSYSMPIPAKLTRGLHTWTNTYSYPVVVTALATLSGSMNALYWSINAGSKRGIYVDENIDSRRSIFIVLRPNESITVKGHSWALWGNKTAVVNYFRMHKTLNNGKELILRVYDAKHININKSQKTAWSGTVTSQSVEGYIQYLYILLSMKSTSNNDRWNNSSIELGDVYFTYTINGVQRTVNVSGLNSTTGYLKINCSEITSTATVTVNVHMLRRACIDEDGNESFRNNTIIIKHVDAFGTIALPNNSTGYALYNKQSKAIKVFEQNSYYKNILSINNSSIAFTKTNTSDFIKYVYSKVSTSARDSWLILTDSGTHYISIDGVKTYITQLLITSSYINYMLSNGEMKTFGGIARYDTIKLYATVAGSTESIETGHIIPYTNGRIIGNDSKPFQSANINVLKATSLNAANGDFKGKVYAQ